jgi:hypothetical protein
VKSDVGDLSLINGRDLKCGVAGNFSAEEVAQVGKQIDAGLVKKCSDAARQSQESLIRMKYDGLLVNVYERNLAPVSILIRLQIVKWKPSKFAGKLMASF